MGNLGTSQFERADGGRLPDGVREGFEVKRGGLLQVGKSLLLGMNVRKSVGQAKPRGR